MSGTATNFIKKFLKNDTRLLKYAAEVVPRLTRAWRASSGKPMSERYALLYLAVDSEIESAKQQASAPVPCVKGCNHCCKFSTIFVTNYEGILLVQFLQNLDPSQRTQAIERIIASTASGAGTPCALLDSTGCSVYPIRPLPCRAFYSLSEPACNNYLHRRGPVPPNLAVTRVVEFAALEVSNSRRHSPLFEVNALLRRIYQDPEKISSWAGGNPTNEGDLAHIPDQI